MKGIIKIVLVAVVVCFVGPSGCVLAYNLWESLGAKPPVTPQVDFDQVQTTCLVAEVAEAAGTYNDQVLAAIAAIRAADGDHPACDNFSKYKILRAPSQAGGPSSIRLPEVVLGKAILNSKWAERIASARLVVDLALKGKFDFKPGDQTVAVARDKIKFCVARIIRVWSVNTADTDEAAMVSEMGLSWTSPSGTRFFCPK